MEKRYELTCLISPDLNEEGLEKKVKEIESKISSLGKETKTEATKKIDLAYMIEKKKQAFLAVFEFLAESEQIPEFKLSLKKEKEILRFLLIIKRVFKEDLEAEQEKTEKKTDSEKKNIEKSMADFEEIEEKLESIN